MFYFTRDFLVVKSVSVVKPFFLIIRVPFAAFKVFEIPSVMTQEWVYSNGQDEIAYKKWGKTKSYM